MKFALIPAALMAVSASACMHDNQMSTRSTMAADGPLSPTEQQILLGARAGEEVDQNTYVPEGTAEERTPVPPQE